MDGIDGIEKKRKEKAYSTHNVENVVRTGFEVIEEIIDKISTIIGDARLGMIFYSILFYSIPYNFPSSIMMVI